MREFLLNYCADVRQQNQAQTVPIAAVTAAMSRMISFVTTCEINIGADGLPDLAAVDRCKVSSMRQTQMNNTKCTDLCLLAAVMPSIYSKHTIKSTRANKKKKKSKKDELFDQADHIKLSNKNGFKPALKDASNVKTVSEQAYILLQLICKDNTDTAVVIMESYVHTLLMESMATSDGASNLLRMIVIGSGGVTDLFTDDDISQFIEYARFEKLDEDAK
eukprot:SAG31_NODE_494_length_14867_cov_2.833762_2_plen_219_part_00